MGWVWGVLGGGLWGFWGVFGESGGFGVFGGFLEVGEVLLGALEMFL